MEFKDISELKDLRKTVLDKAYSLKIISRDFRIESKSKNHSIFKKFQDAIYSSTGKKLDRETLRKFLTTNDKLLFHDGVVDILIEFAEYKKDLVNYENSIVAAKKHYLIGEEQEKKLKMQEALVEYKNAYLLQPNEPKYLIKYAKILNGFGDYETANILLNKSREILERSGLKTSKMYYDNLLELGFVVYNMELPKEALAIYKQIIELATKVFDETNLLLAPAYNFASHCAISIGETVVARDLNNSLFNLFRNKKVDTGEDFAFALKIKGMVAKAEGNYEEALHQFNQALEIYKKLPFTLWIFDVFTCIGVVRLDLHQYESALKSFETARELEEKVWGKNTRKTVAHLVRIASAYSRLGKLEEAKSILSVALKSAEKLIKGKNLFYVALYNNRGRLNWKLGMEQESKEDWKRAEELSFELYPMGKEGLATIYSNLGFYYTLSNEASFKLAKAYFARASDIMDGVFAKDSFEYGVLYSRISRLCFEKGKQETKTANKKLERKKGLQFSEKALLIFRKIFKDGKHEEFSLAEDNKKLLSTL